MRKWLFVFVGSAFGLAACDTSGPGNPPVGPGVTCEPACAGDATCSVDGNFASCLCPSGFAYDASVGCVNIDECATGTARCGDSFDCEDTAGSYRCVCPDGLIEDGDDCKDDESSLTRVTGLVAAVAGDAVTLTWNSVEGADEYVVYRGNSEVFSSETWTEVGRVEAAEWLGTLPRGSIVAGDYVATPYAGRVSTGLRNDGVTIDLLETPRRDPGSEQFFVVVPRRLADASILDGLASSAKSATSEVLPLECVWQVRRSGTWSMFTPTTTVGGLLYATTDTQVMGFRCLPALEGEIVDELKGNPALADDLPVAEGFIGTCFDGRRSSAPFEDATDCGGMCARACVAPTYRGEIGPITVIVGETKDVDISWTAVPALDVLDIDAPDFMTVVEGANGARTLHVPSVLAGIGSHRIRMTASNEFGSAPVVIELLIEVRPRKVEKLALGTFGCALIEGNLLKCFGQNPGGVLGRGDMRQPGILTPIHHVEPVAMALNATTGERVIDISVGREVACALIRNTAGQKRISCWGGLVDDLPVFTDSGNSVPTAAQLLNVATVPGGNDVFGDQANEVPGALTVSGPLSAVIAGADRVIVGRPWLCVENGNTLYCDDKGTLSTITGVRDVWTSPGFFMHCVATNTGAWCGMGAPNESDRAVGGVSLPASASGGIVKLGMAMAHQAVAAMDGAGNVFVGRFSQGGSGGAPVIDFPATPQFTGATDLVVSTNAVCAIRNAQAWCWGTSFERFPSAVPAPGLGSTDSTLPPELWTELMNPGEITFAKAPDLLGEHWSLSARGLCTYNSNDDRLWCRQAPVRGAFDSADALASAFARARVCGTNVSCVFEAYVSGFTQLSARVQNEIFYGTSSLRPGWIPVTETAFEHHLVLGPPVNYGQGFPDFLAAPPARWNLSFWFAGSDLEAEVLYGTDVLFMSCGGQSGGLLDSEPALGCAEVVPLTNTTQARWSYRVSDGYHDPVTVNHRSHVTSTPTVSQVAVGAAHVCALSQSDEGALYCWGSNEHGQLGIPSVGQEMTTLRSLAHSEVVQRVPFHLGGARIRSIAAGRHQTCAVIDRTTNGDPAIVCVGDNTFGSAAPQLRAACTTGQDCACSDGSCRIESFDIANAFDLGADVKTIVELVLGDANACAVVETTTGARRVTCWGDLRFVNALDSVPTWETTSIFPMNVGTLSGRFVHFALSDFAVASNPTKIVSVAIGRRHMCTLVNRSSGSTAVCIGDNRKQQVTGIGGGLTHYNQWAVGGSVAPLSHASVGVGRDFSCVSGKNDVKCWGANDRGQLGRPTVGSISSVVAEGGGALALSESPVGGSQNLAVGTDHACAVDSMQRLHCWGENRGLNGWIVLGKGATADDRTFTDESHAFLPSFGRLGAGTLAPFSSVARFAGILHSGVVSMDTYGSTTCVVDGGGELRCFGQPVAGETGRPGTWGDDELGLMGPATSVF